MTAPADMEVTESHTQDGYDWPTPHPVSPLRDSCDACNGVGIPQDQQHRRELYCNACERVMFNA